MSFKRPPILQSFGFAFRGLVYVIRQERSMQLHLVFAAFAIFFGWYFNLSSLEWMAYIISMLLVLIAEAFNTAIELTVDLITSEHHPLAMYAKDAAAGAVFLTVINALVVGYFLFYDRISGLVI